MKSLSRRVITAGWLWRTPGMVVAVILAVTSVVALIQQRESTRRRDLVFEAQSEQLRQEILEAIDRQGERFRIAVDFVAVTHPGPIDQFRSYFDRQREASGRQNASSFNFILIERVGLDEFARLEDREMALGNVDFAVRSLAEGTGDRLVITRTAADVVDGEIDVNGLDVTGFDEQFPEVVPENGYALRVLEPGPTLRFLLQLTGTVEATEDQIEASSTYAILVSPVPSGDGTAVDGTGADGTAADGLAAADGLVAAVRLVPIDELLAPVDRRLVRGLQASLLVDGIDGPVTVLTGVNGAPNGPTDLREDYALDIDGQRWTLSITAGPGYGPATGLFANRTVWAFGVTTAILAAMALLARAWHERRVVRAELELASALTVASTDGLTGLLNRVGFLQRSGRLDDTDPATVLFIDLDGFKAVNDLDGHDAGDRVLQEVAARLTRTTRSEDLVSRLGGDEFIIHVPGADEETASRLASRVIDTIDQVDERLSCSVGVAIRQPGAMVPVDELLRRADAAMYKVKRSGGRGYHLVRSGPASSGPAPGAEALTSSAVGGEVFRAE